MSTWIETHTNSIYTCTKHYITFRVTVHHFFMYIYGLGCTHLERYIQCTHTRHINKQKVEFCSVPRVCMSETFHSEMKQSRQGAQDPFLSKKRLDKAPQTFDRSNHKKSLALVV